MELQIKYVTSSMKRPQSRTDSGRLKDLPGAADGIENGYKYINLDSPQEENFGMGDATLLEAVSSRTKLTHTGFKLVSYNMICNTPVTLLRFDTAQAGVWS